MKKRLTTLNFVRAAACLGVFTFHCYISLLGAWAVSVFVMLSGFLLTYNSIDRVDSFPRGVKGCAKYSFKKIKKLYPLYALTLFILMIRIVILAPENPPINEIIHFAKQFLYDFLLIQSWLLSTEWAFAHNGVGWYLSTCVLLYFAYPCILRWIKGHDGIKSAFRSIALIFALMALCSAIAPAFERLLASAGLPVDYSFMHWFCYIFPVYRLGDFAIGALVGYIFTLTPEENFSQAGATWLELLAIALAAVSQWVFSAGLLPTQFSYNLLFVPSSAMLVFFFALGRGHISRALDCKASAVISDYSVEIFLIHFAVIKYASPFSTFLPVPFRLQQVSFLCFAFFITFISVYIYRRFSRRFPFFSVR